jgi:hypothetical protein
MWGAAAGQVGKNADRGSVKWEYKVIRAESTLRRIDTDKTEEALNKLGQDGWECVGTISEVSGAQAKGMLTHGILICKRAKR